MFPQTWLRNGVSSLDRLWLQAFRAPAPCIRGQAGYFRFCAGREFNFGFKVIEVHFCLAPCLLWKALLLGEFHEGSLGLLAMSLCARRQYALDCLVRSSSRGLQRFFSSASGVRSRTGEQIDRVEEKGAAALSPRWLSDLKRRIGKCISFGLRPEQVRKAGDVLQVVGREWRNLVAGSEGFLTGPGRAGLERHRVVWGEMDSMVCIFSGRVGMAMGIWADMIE